MTDQTTGQPRLVGGRYQLVEQIGRGGMAEVWSAHDTRLGRNVAVKLLRTDLARDPSFQARFKREAQSSASLNHPAIVSVYDTGEDTALDPYGAPAPQPYIVMEQVHGRTIKQILQESSPLDIDDAMRITVGVLDALQYSHRGGIIHRDIKPANVMVTDAGEIKVMDFGIARAMADTSATMTGTNAVMGTAQYLSPEQARGETVDERSDLYSAGCLLYELLTGRPAVRRRERARAGLPARRGDPAAAEQPQPRGARPTWTPSCSTRWPSPARTATRTPASSSPTSTGWPPGCPVQPPCRWPGRAPRPPRPP